MLTINSPAFTSSILTDDDGVETRWDDMRTSIHSFWTSVHAVRYICGSRMLALGVTNLFVTGARDCENARDRENARDQVAPTSHVTVGTHMTYHVTSGPLGYHVTYHVTHHVIQLA